MISTLPNRRPSAATVAAALVVLALATGTGAATAADAAANETTLTVADATVEPNENGTVRVSLDRVPEGLAGFELVLSLETPDVATVTGARYPDGYQPTTDPTIGESGETITVEAADLGKTVQAGATNVTLASVSLVGSERGAVELTVTEAQVDADGGSRVDPAVEAGTVSVGPGGDDASASDDAAGDGGAVPNDGSPAGGGENDVSADSFPVDIAGLGALAVLAGVIAVGVFVWRD